MMGDVDSKDNVVVLKTAFLIGAVADGMIVIEWFLISLGLLYVPVHPNFFAGSGQDFQYVLSTGGLLYDGLGFFTLLGQCAANRAKRNSANYSGNAICRDTLGLHYFCTPLFNTTNCAGHIIKAFSCNIICWQLLAFKKNAWLITPVI
jgi:hypothetical protein